MHISILPLIRVTRELGSQHMLRESGNGRGQRTPSTQSSSQQPAPAEQSQYRPGGPHQSFMGSRTELMLVDSSTTTTPQVNPNLQVSDLDLYNEHSVLLSQVLHVSHGGEAISSQYVATEVASLCIWLYLNQNW